MRASVTERTRAGSAAGAAARGLLIAALAIAAGACSLKADYTGTLFACDDAGACPEHYTCLDQLCVPEPSPPDQAAPGACTMAVAAAGLHTCALRTDGTAWCWGRNDLGQLGQGTATSQLVDRPSPVQVQGDPVNDAGAGVPLPKLTQLAAGADHTCALAEDHRVFCWGQNASGQLGNGKTMDAAAVEVARMTDAIAVASGDSFSCALHADQHVSCWGAASAGQLGNGGAESSNVPDDVKLPATTHVTAIVASGSTACAVDAERGVWCWGANASGQFAINKATTPTSVPVPSMYTNVTSLVLGAAFSCALTTDGNVMCAGANESGQIGNGALTSTAPAVLTPSPVALGHRSVALTAGASFACAAAEDGGVWCWGQNDNDQFAATATGNQPYPVLTGYTAAKDLAAGIAHLCVRSAAGALACSGFDGRGQLGDGHRTTQPLPQPVPGLDGVSSLVAGSLDMCALRDDHSVWCWGDNSAGQLGDGTKLDHRRPTPIDPLAGATRVVLGNRHGCAVLADSSVACWGDSSENQLGDNTTTSDTVLAHIVPEPVFDITKTKLTGVAELAAAGDHTCALMTTGEVQCWGSNESLQSGTTGSEVHLAVKVGFVAGTRIAQLALGSRHSCALDTDHKVWCWGTNASLQLGRTVSFATATPGNPDNLPAGNIDHISSHGDTTCVHTTDGTIWCWGFGADGALGTGGIVNANPARLNALTNTLDVAVGGHHACALNADHSLACWGGGSLGAIGDGSYDSRKSPVAIGLMNVQQMVGTAFSMCARLADGTVACWGDGRNGELGDGTANLHVPVTPVLPCP